MLEFKSYLSYIGMVYTNAHIQQSHTHICVADYAVSSHALLPQIGQSRIFDMSLCNEFDMLLAELNFTA